jgi:hypothetical protein
MNHITSPDNTDPGIERAILTMGLTAPRVTTENIEANIVGEHYFLASEAAGMSPVGGGVYADPRPYHAMDLLTFCVLVLRNGFTVTGESACVSAENFNAEIGKRIARANAVQKIWPLMGYALKEQLK